MFGGHFKPLDIIWGNKFKKIENFTNFDEKISFEWNSSNFCNTKFGLKVFISSYSGKHEFYGLIRTLLSGSDLPYKIFKLYLWEAFSKVKIIEVRIFCQQI
jgi:hypothetical protein